MITKIKEIIRHLGLKEDEVIITVEELEKLKNKQQVKTPKSKKNKNKIKRHSAKILWNDRNNKGQVKEYKNGQIKYYINIDGIVYTKQGTKENMIKLGTEFANVNYDINQWETLEKKYQTIRTYHKKNGTPTYIYKDKYGRYYISKRIGTKQVNFGLYSTSELAEEVVQFLIFKDWDLQYLPKQLLPAHQRSFGVDEYYNTIAAIMFADKEYQQYKNKRSVLL